MEKIDLAANSKAPLQIEDYHFSVVGKSFSTKILQHWNDNN